MFMMETKIDAQRLELIRDKCGYGNGICLSSNGRSGGMGLWWRDIKINICSYSVHHVEAEICDNDNIPRWKAINIYGWSETSNKHLTWELMKNLKLRSSLPVVMYGDFNEIISMQEKDWGPVRTERHIDAFREAIDVCEFPDLGFKGNIFTWQRGISLETLVRERLDRYIADEQWFCMFLYA